VTYLAHVWSLLCFRIQIVFDEMLEAKLVDREDFDLCHSEGVASDGSKIRRVMHLRDLMGDAERWVRAINECRVSAVKVENLYTRAIPKFFEIQGVLLKKHKTSKGWDKRFFVLSVRCLFACVLLSSWGRWGGEVTSSCACRCCCVCGSSFYRELWVHRFRCLGLTSLFGCCCVGRCPPPPPSPSPRAFNLHRTKPSSTSPSPVTSVAAATISCGTTHAWCGALRPCAPCRSL
jgi:hypothetical protein